MIAKTFFIGTTVILETERVLRRVYGFEPLEAATALSGFAGLGSVTLEGAPLVGRALDWVSQSMDFADALHLAKAQTCGAMATFDHRFASIANKLSAVAIRSSQLEKRRNESAALERRRVSTTG